MVWLDVYLFILVGGESLENVIAVRGENHHALTKKQQTLSKNILFKIRTQKGEKKQGMLLFLIGIYILFLCGYTDERAAICERSKWGH